MYQHTYGLGVGSMKNVTNETLCSRQRSTRDRRMLSTTSPLAYQLPGHSLRYWGVYPNNCQCHLRNPKPLLNIPLLSRIAPAEQLRQKRKRASQPPPHRWHSTQSPTKYKRKMPPLINTKDHGDSGMQSRSRGWRRGRAVR